MYYEVTTNLETTLTTTNREEALEYAERVHENYYYTEVKEVESGRNYIAHSIKIYH